MALDIIGITLIILFFIRGYMKGIIVAVFSMLAVIFGIICALKLSERLATWLFDKGYITSGWGQLISYIVIFTAAFLLVRIIAKAIDSVTKAAALGWLNGLVGGFMYSFMMAVVWSSILWICGQMQIIKPETIAASKTYPYFAKLAPWLFEKIGLLWPMVKDIFADLQVFFANVNKKI